MKRIAFMGIIMSFAWQGFSQGFTDNALLFSRTTPGGSARIQALGGTQISLGGDYSSAFGNPAGLGMYNRSEFTFSPAVTVGDISANYQGESVATTKPVFNIPGLSAVFYMPSSKEKGYLGGSFAITMNRTNDLQSKYSYQGNNSSSSIVDYFLDEANYYVQENPYYDPSDLEVGGADFYSLTGLAYNNYLIDPYYEDDDETKDLLGFGSVLSPLYEEDEVRTERQREYIDRRGAQYQWSISYGANFNDIFFVGAGIGIASIRYKLTQVYRESDFAYSVETTYDPVASFQVKEDLEIEGSGINFTTGFVLRPVSFFQIGASYATPTYYQLTDTYNASMKSDWNGYDDENVSFDVPLVSEYSIATPHKLNFGATFISKIGFISADMEMTNYSKAKYGAQDAYSSFDYENDEIHTLYTSVKNYRVGAEGRYEMFRIRAGYSYMPNPYRDDEGADYSITRISGGLGVRWNNAYLDLAVVRSSTESIRIPYTAEGFPTPTASVKETKTNYMATVGFTF